MYVHSRSHWQYVAHVRREDTWIFYKYVNELLTQRRKSACVLLTQVVRAPDQGELSATGLAPMAYLYFLQRT